MYKKRIILVTSVGILIAILFSLLLSINRVLNKFDDLSKLPNPDSSFSLPSSKLILKNIKTLNYDTLDFKNLKVINFWASWCIPCIEEHNSLEQLSKKVNVIQFSFDSISSLKKTISSNNWQIPSYHLSDSTIFKVPIILPTTIVLKDSIVVRQFFGKRNWEDTAFTNYFKNLEN